MKILFAGTPQFAVPSLQALIASKHEVTAVYTQPDRRAGRGRHLQPSPVKEIAILNDIPVCQPRNLRSEADQLTLLAHHADLMVVVAYGLILPKKVLEIPHFGCINVHASLLPRWRGAAPIQHAILSGDTESGVTIMQISEGLDEGDMLAKVTCPITETTTGTQLHEALATMGAKALLPVIDQVDAGKENITPQDHTKANYAHKIKKQDAAINWSQSAVEINRLIRAFQPWPVAFTQRDDQVVRVWKGIPLSELTDESPGTILRADAAGIDVATGDGVLRLLELQLPGGRVLPVQEILNSRQTLFSEGSRFI
ncbi:MAG: methionyl-tRNA formyltransferase [marine bacterium B5-7]|nr:MAG: methionyl-tRNA formyltransferase [marine bacterium B5-7]